VRWLAATGLLFKVVHRDALTLEQSNGVQARLGRELIDEAGGEQIDVCRLGWIPPDTWGVGLMLHFQPFGKVVIPVCFIVKIG
jgi:hypothetical protein